jgi:hypothetical protein
MSQENGRETANRIGTINSDGSQDFGCFVVNNEAHPEFFASQNWSDPVSNSRYLQHLSGAGQLVGLVRRMHPEQGSEVPGHLVQVVIRGNHND